MLFEFLYTYNCPTIIFSYYCFDLISFDLIYKIKVIFKIELINQADTPLLLKYSNYVIFLKSNSIIYLYLVNYNSMNLIYILVHVLTF